MYMIVRPRLLSQFLSMKLAAVHPEINLNVEQSLLKDVRLLYSDGNGFVFW